MKAYNRAAEVQFDILLDDEWRHSIEPDVVDRFGSIVLADEYSQYMDDEFWRELTARDDDDYYDYWDDYSIMESMRPDDLDLYGWDNYYHPRYRNTYWEEPVRQYVEPDHADYWRDYLDRCGATTCVVFYGKPGVYPAA